MSVSQSTPVNKTATTTNATETNENVSGTQGVTLVGNTAPVTVNSTDEGAVQAGTATANLAISSNTGLTEALASDYENEVNTSATASTNLVNNTLQAGFQFLASADNTQANVDQTNANNLSQAYANYATTLSNLATQTSTPASQQITNVSTELIKVAAVVILGVALIYFAARK